MNTPSAKTDGFSPNAWHYNTFVSGRRPVPGPLQNYLSTDMIATSRQPAGTAIVPTIRKHLRHARSAHTHLGGSASIDLPELPPGAFCLVRDKVQKHRPTGIVNGLRQHPGGKPFHVQILDRDHTETINDPAGFPVLKICPLIGNINVRPLKAQYGLAAALASLLTPCHFALASPQPGLCVPVVARVFDFSAVRQDGERCQANVDPNPFGRHGQRFELQAPR